MDQVKGIKACQEMIKGLTDIAMAIAMLINMKDGKVGLNDIGPIMGLLSKQGDLVDAIKDAGQIPSEIKDLSEDEIETLLQAVLDAVHAVKAT